ncbi:MAG: hypothetical protein WDZ76_13045 [Pseudohongiellaceae bacterium]
MMINWTRLILHCAALLLAVTLAVAIAQNPETLGTLPLLLRSLPTLLTAVLAIFAVYPLVPGLRHRPLLYASAVGFPVAGLCLAYYLVYLPGQSQGGVSGEQLASALITDNTSNGIIEVGFSYPIYTPTLALTSNELFTRDVDVYLRITDANNEDLLFRAVRQIIGGGALSVEASVNGLLSRNPEYLFIPVTLPPNRTVVGQIVFIISNLDDGTTFNEALGRAYPARFELRDPESGDLIDAFPLTRL